MKLAGKLILPIIFTVVLCESAAAQSQRVSIQLKNASVAEFLQAVEAQTSYKFSYKENDLPKQKDINLSERNATLATVLGSVLSKHGLAYDVVSEQSIIVKAVRTSEKTAKAARPAIVRKTISGTILDEKGEPVAGAAVVEQGSGNGTVANLDGKFTITAADNAVLRFSSTGYLTQDIATGKRHEVNVVLKEDVQGIEELVFVGYGSEKRLNLSGAVASIDSKAILNRPVATTVSGLQGLMAGLNITQDSGEPGTEPSYNVRGTTNLINSSALVLVDGVEMNANLINPADIKDVVVLKDAASSAIYGAKAAFGVILITTKEGYASKKPEITFSGNFSVNTPTTWYEGMSSLARADYLNSSSMTENGVPEYTRQEYEMIRKYHEDPANNPDWWAGNTNNAFPNRYTYCANTDWNEALNKRYAGQYTYNVNIQGGNKDMKYYSSVGYFDQDGYTKWYDDSFNRITNVNNFSYNVTGWLQLGISTSLTVQNRDDSIYSSVFIHRVTPPTYPVFNPDGSFAGADDDLIGNPAQAISEGGCRTDSQRQFLVTGSFKLTPLNGLEIKGDYTYKYNNSDEKLLQKVTYTSDLVGNKLINTLDGSTRTNSVQYDRTNAQRFILNLYADFSRTFARNHNLKILVGYNQDLLSKISTMMKRYNLISEEIPYVKPATGEMLMADDKQEVASRGVFYRLNYNYKEKYLLEFNGRYDGTSRFPKGSRFQLFPSASAGWRVSDEPFWSPLSKVVSDFKLRASWGSLGNQIVGSYYPYISQYGMISSADYLFAGQKELAVMAPGLVAGDLTWETVTTLDFGFDASFFNNKLSTSFDLYKRKTEGMLATAKTLPAVIGAKDPEVNAANLEVKGWEATIAWRDVADDFRYDISFNISDYQGEITKYEDETHVIGNHYVGERFGEIWGFRTEGYFKTDEEAATWNQKAVFGFRPLAGDLKLADTDGSGSVDFGANTVGSHGDKLIIGNDTPRYAFGLRGSFEWKNLDFSMFLQGVGKRDVETRYLYEVYNSQWGIGIKDAADYWTPEHTDARYPRPRCNADYAGQKDIVLDCFVSDGAFMRLKNACLGYTVPSGLTQKVNIDKLRIYLSAENALTFKRMSRFIDPEVIEATSYPLTRSFSAGINLTF